MPGGLPSDGGAFFDSGTFDQTTFDAGLETLPFSLAVWSAVSSVKISPPPPVVRNLALLTVVVATLPFNTSSVLVPSNRVKLTPPDQLHTNIAQFTNPIPNNNSSLQVPVYGVRASKPRDHAIDITRFTNPIPLNKSDWAYSFRVPDFLPSATPQNLLPSTSVVVSAPFTPLDTSYSRRNPAITPQAQPYNSLIFSGVPFYQLDWSKPQKPGVPPPQALPYSPLVYSEVPFYQNTWLTPSRLGLNSSINYPNLPVLNTLSTPFAQYDWSKPFRVMGSTPAPVNNYSVITAQPFAQYIWPAVQQVKTARDTTQPTNIALYTIVQNPFAQYIWPVVQAIKPSAAPQLGVNLNIITPPAPLPFAQYDWSKPQRVTGVLYPLTFQYFPLLNTVPLGIGPRRPLYLLGSSGYGVSYWPDGKNGFKDNG